MLRRVRPPVWAWFVFVPVALVVLAWGALALLLPPARARALVTAQLSRRLAREVRFEDARVAWWPLVRLEVRGLELAEPGGFAKGAAFSCGTIALDLDAWALLSRTVRVRRLELLAPELHLVRHADGRTNLDGLVTTEPHAADPGTALDLDVQRFTIRDGRVLVDDLAGSRRTVLRLATRMTLVADRRGTRLSTSGETEVTGLAVGPLTATRLSELDPALASLTWRLSHRGTYDAAQQRLALEALTLTFGRTGLTCVGVVDSVGLRPRVDLRVEGTRLDVASLLEWASHAEVAAIEGVRGRGTLAFALRVRGAIVPGARPEVTGTVRLTDGALRHPASPTEVTAIAFAATLRPDSVRVESLRATVAGQPLTADLVAWSFADPHVAFRVRGDVDLAVVAPLVAPAGTAVAGRVALDLQGRGRTAEPAGMALGGTATLREVRVVTPGSPQPLEHVNGRLSFADDVARVSGLSLRAGGSALTLDARVTQPLALLAPPDRHAPALVEFTLDSPGLDLADLLPTTPGAPFLPNARGTGRVRLARLQQDRLAVRDVEADVRLLPAILEVPRFALAGYGGTVSGRARFDLHDTQRPLVDVHTTVTGVHADSLLAAWTPVRGLLAGTLDTKLELASEGRAIADVKRTLTLVALASVREGRLGPGPAFEAVSRFVNVPRLRQLDFTRLDLPLRIEHGRVVTDPVVITGAAGEWRLAGAVGFDGSLDYAVSVTLPATALPALEARSALAAGALSDAQGRLLLDLRVTGPAAAPRVTWDTRAMQARLAGRASAALTEQRARLEAEAREAAQRALEARLTGRRDSLTTTPITPGAVRDTLASAARGLLRGFFSRGSRPAAPDTTKH